MKSIFVLGLIFLSSSSLLNASGRFKPHEATPEQIKVKIGRLSMKVKESYTTSAKVDYLASQISHLNSLLEARQLPEDNELKGILQQTAAEAFLETKKRKPLFVDEKKAELTCFQSTDLIKRNFGKYMVVGCYHDFQADDHSDHKHVGAITVNILDKFDPNAKNEAEIKLSISDSKFLAHPTVQKLIGTLDTIYLEFVTIPTLSNPMTFKNAFTLLKPGGRLIYDNYLKIGFEPGEKDIDIYPFGVELKNAVKAGLTGSREAEIREELVLKSISAFKEVLEKEQMPTQSWYALKGVNPFNNRKESTLIMIEKMGKQEVQMPFPKTTRYTPTETTENTLRMLQSLIKAGAIDPNSQAIEDMVNVACGQDIVRLLQGPGLRWVEDQLKKK